jgi:hypothetical protein
MALTEAVNRRVGMHLYMRTEDSVKKWVWPLLRRQQDLEYSTNGCYISRMTGDETIYKTINHLVELETQ